DLGRLPPARPVAHALVRRHRPRTQHRTQAHPATRRSSARREHARSRDDLHRPTALVDARRGRALGELGPLAVSPNFPGMLVSVPPPVPLFHTFTYDVPPDLTSGERARPGMRVVVPFRNRRAMGVIVATDVDPGSVPAKPVDSIPDEEPVMSAEMLSLCAWIAEYYVAPVGVVIRSALPAPLASHAAPEPSRRTRRVVAIRDELPSLMEREKTFARAPQQRALFELIQSIGGPVPVEHLTERHKFSPAVL